MTTTVVVLAVRSVDPERRRRKGQIDLSRLSHWVVVKVCALKAGGRLPHERADACFSRHVALVIS